MYNPTKCYPYRSDAADTRHVDDCALGLLQMRDTHLRHHENRPHENVIAPVKVVYLTVINIAAYGATCDIQLQDGMVWNSRGYWSDWRLSIFKNRISKNSIDSTLRFCQSEILHSLWLCTFHWSYNSMKSYTVLKNGMQWRLSYKVV